MKPTLVGDDGRVIEVTREEFEDLVGEGLDLIPDELARLMDNVVVLVEDYPPQGRRLLGLYYGVPLTERGRRTPGCSPTPSTSTGSRSCGCAESTEEVVEQVRRTVMHEVAHHFGISDERLHELDAY